MTKEIDLGEFNIASVDRLRTTLKKDGVLWTGIDSVLLTFEKPDRATRFTRSMTNELPDVGVWYYDTTLTDLDVIGRWTLSVLITDGPIIKRYPYEISLTVNDNP